MRDMSHSYVEDGLRDQAGYALPIVLVFLGIVAAVSARFVGEARLELDMQRALRDRTALETLARDVTLHFQPAWVNGARDASVSFFCAARAYDVTLSVWPQDRLTDLNTASAERLAVALGIVGVPAQAADDVAAEIIRFRGYDPYGRAEAGQASVVDGLKHGPFEAVEELVDFDALATIQPARLRQVFTIRSRSGDASARDVAGAFALSVQATRRDGRASASFGAVLSAGPTTPSARLIEVFDPGRPTAFPPPDTPSCPEPLARLIAQRSEVSEAAR